MQSSMVPAGRRPVADASVGPCAGRRRGRLADRGRRAQHQPGPPGQRLPEPVPQTGPGSSRRMCLFDCATARRAVEDALHRSVPPPTPPPLPYLRSCTGLLRLSVPGCTREGTVPTAASVREGSSAWSPSDAGGRGLPSAGALRAMPRTTAGSLFGWPFPLSP
jgi:hypothetical protein